MADNNLQKRCDARWYGFQLAEIDHAFAEYDLDADDHRVRQVIRRLLTQQFQAGARWNMEETTRLSPYVNQFIEMLILLGVFDAESESAQSGNAANSATEGS